MLYTDPTFAQGTNSTNRYANSGSENLKWERVAASSDNPMDGAAYEMRCTCTGAVNPANGGFYFGNMSRANAVFVYRIVAKVPSGRSLAFATNGIGTGSKTSWLTPSSGTGKFAEYLFKVVCGATGTFSTTGYFYVNGAQPSASSPLEWRVAYATCFDMTAASDAQQALSSVRLVETTVEELSSNVEQTNSSITDTLSRKTAEITSLQQQLAGVVVDLGAVGARVDEVEASFSRTMDAQGNPVLTLATTANGLAAQLTNSQLSFLDGGAVVAYIGGKKLYISQAEVTGQMTMGDYSWVPRDGGHLSLKYTG